MRSRDLAVLLLLGCAGFERGAPSNDLPGDRGSEPGVVVNGYAADVHPILVDRCQSCHSVSGSASSSSYVMSGDASDDYNAALELVNLGRPERSRLLSQAAGVGHGGGPILSVGGTEYATLLAWIVAGADP